MNIFKLNKNSDYVEILSCIILRKKLISEYFFNKKRIQNFLNPLLYFLKTIDYSVQSFGEDFL